MIIDAGGGTVDFSTYTFANAEPVEIEELVISEGKYRFHPTSDPLSQSTF
jgi:hypothetical protein